LDELVGGLPASATKHHPQWWHGDRPNTRAWRHAGYQLDQVELGRSVTFCRITERLDRKSRDLEATSRSKNDLAHATTAAATLAGVDPARALIVLQCSAAKATGGIGARVQPAPWPAALYRARSAVRHSADVDDQQVMPAWRRYTGGFYAEAGEVLGQALASGAQVLIISGGYGILRADEPVGTYDKKFRLSDWPEGLLSELLVDEAASLTVDAVVAFTGASTDYARLLRQTPWNRSGVADALLVTIAATGGGAMVKVPRGLGRAFCAFWQRNPWSYPSQSVVARLM
jgi:hypothetical protein